MKKRTFVLFEILIAFFLAAICAVPLVSQPLKMFRSEMKFLEQLERERLADWTFLEIKEILWKNQIPWEKIPAKGVKTPPFSLPPSEISLPGCSPKKVQRTFTLHCRGEKEGLRDETYRLLYVEITFSPPVSKKNSYTFRTTVQKLPS